jgi:transposase InsO family protein
LRAAVVRQAGQCGRYGYRRITGLLGQEGWRVSRARVERLWKQEGLKVPAKQPKRRRLWLADGSCVRLRPTHRQQVRAWDFVMDRSMAFFTYSNERYSPCSFGNGSSIGNPEQAFEIGARYLG